MWGKWIILIGLILGGAGLLTDPAWGAPKRMPVPKAKTVQKHDSGSKPASVDPSLVFGKTGAKPGEFQTIDGVWVDPRGRILVVDKGNNRVNFFTGGGRFLNSFGTQGEGPGQFNECTGIVVDGQQRIIISDQNNFRVQVFDLDGKFLTAFGRQGSGDGEFLEPMGLALDGRGLLYVADGTRDDIQVFDQNFVFVRKFGSLNSEAGRMEMVESVGVSVGPPPEQEVYVSDEKNSRIHRFGPDGTHRGTIGRQGVGPGMFAKEVEGLTFDSLGYLYAVDESGGKIEIFTPEGKPVHSFGGGLGLKPGQFNSPDGIHYSSLYDSILVADQRNRRVQMFHLEDIWKNKKRVKQRGHHQQAGSPGGDGKL